MNLLIIKKSADVIYAFNFLGLFQKIFSRKKNTIYTGFYLKVLFILYNKILFFQMKYRYFLNAYAI